MKAHTDSFTISTRGKGTHEITQEVARTVRESGVKAGAATVFIQHTSASLVIYENADPSARADLHAFFEKLVPEDEAYYIHTMEGSDDTTSHLRMRRSGYRREKTMSGFLSGSRFGYVAPSALVLFTFLATRWAR